MKRYFFVPFNASTEAKVNHLGWKIFIEDDILKLDIPVRDLFLMQIAESFGEGFDDAATDLFGGFMVRQWFEIMVQRYAGKILHDDVEMIVGLHNIVDLDDVGVLQHLQYFYFSADWFFSLRLFDFVLFIDLYCHFLVFWLKYCYSHRSVRSLADHLPHQVILFELSR